ncbi:ATPase type 13A [Capsaspora owczarzaki ATCC 30864]|uniref:ATPase type 13A n=1 Tax=Capsaspora owczarzaki (strain ATCC 30864) TaxID=595528 RepID=A0A0D2WQU4_CAPO3|nr:ATPase type 13A [Capsaspora owczarzaki ATCC 30864]KJE93443.1 ATPase type 13A [Capsaspora owczarzaki ATCC 30864]|eukprot:XP_004348060.1 ATPase type 13A [Capsaspora owczarzaki ATCC 30864]
MPLPGVARADLAGVSLHVRKRSPWLYGYVWPFAVLYLAWFLVVFVHFEAWRAIDLEGADAAEAAAADARLPADEYLGDVLNATAAGVSGGSSDALLATSDEPPRVRSTEELALEYGLLALFGLVFANILTVLACEWSVDVKIRMTCSPASDIYSATLVKATPLPNSGAAELVPLLFKQSLSSATARPDVMFVFQKTQFVYDAEKNQFGTVDLPIGRPLSFYRAARGLSDETEVERTERKYGPNKFDIPIPPFSQLFKEHATAPFFVFQVFCVLLWCLDEYWYYSVFTLVMLVVFEATVVQQRLRNLRELRQMRLKRYQIYVFRDRKWRQIPSDRILPGDLCSFTRHQDDTAMPCDALLLSGTCIVNEAMLTGESVPQMKEPVHPTAEDLLDIERGSKVSLVFGGTKIVQHAAAEERTEDKYHAPDGGCVGYALRTGFNTSQGKLVRTILFSTERVTANTLESFMFILFLLIFAIAASVYVWIYGAESNPDRSTYKLLLECILIITSVVPPELPMELSLAVNSSLIALAKFAIFCTEPFRIPLAGKVDICCFDKTGTLTSNDLIVEGVAGISATNPEEILAVGDSPDHTTHVLVTCHSLMHVDDGLVGDPMERATLLAANWNLTKGDVAIPKKSNKRQTLKILQRHHFSSALKRMSAVCSLDLEGQLSVVVTVKGAPEMIAGMLEQVPDFYEETHKAFARRGARVLALAYKKLRDVSQHAAKDIPREQLECGLTFAGFLILRCPLKPDSQAALKMIADASHLMVMITGDNPLTACHVARDVHIASKPLLILGGGDADLHAEAGECTWQSVDEKEGFPLAQLLPGNSDRARILAKYDLCVTGSGLKHVLTSDPRVFNGMLPFIHVFARVTPDQKEAIVVAMKNAGYVTLMCGDGTNDVGALKQAQVGIALLDGTPESLAKERERLRALARERARKMAEDMAARWGAARPRATLPNGTAAPELTPRQQQQQQQMANASKAMSDMMPDMEDAEVPLVKLGDASIASPFTSKLNSVMAVCHIIRQGRCTLVTTLQMFRILALNCLISAYSLSVLYLDGVRLGDVQATAQGMLLAGCFLFISRSQPAEKLSKQRPLPNIFNPYMLLTVLCQFAVHLACLMFVVYEAKLLSHESDAVRRKHDKKFEPSILNSAVYIIAMCMQISTVTVNYQGRPFMQGLSENKPLRIAIMISFGIIVATVSGLFPEVASGLQIVEFDAEFRAKLIGALVVDLGVTFSLDRLLGAIFNRNVPRFVTY